MFFVGARRVLRPIREWSFYSSRLPGTEGRNGVKELFSRSTTARQDKQILSFDRLRTGALLRMGINAKKSWFLSRAKIDIPLQIGIPMGPYEPAVLPILVFESGEISL